MFTIVGCVVLGVVAILLVRFIFFRGEDRVDAILNNAICSIIAAIAGLIVGVLLATTIGANLPQKEQAVATYRLVNLRDNLGIQGNFFLASGSVGTQQEYLYYYQLPSGGYKSGRMASSDNLTIFEENRSDGELVVLQPAFSFDWEWRWGIHKGGETYEFHVPKGSIFSGFHLGA